MGVWRYLKILLKKNVFYFEYEKQNKNKRMNKKLTNDVFCCNISLLFLFI